MERQLVVQAQQGDRDAFDLLVSLTVDRLYSVAYRILRNGPSAEDATQQALVSIWRHLPSLRDLDRFDAWAYRLLVNAAYAEHRHSRREAPPGALTDGATDTDPYPSVHDRALLGGQTCEAPLQLVPQPGTVNLTGMEVCSPGTDLIAPPEYFRSRSEDGVLVVSAHELLEGESLSDFAGRVSRESACGGSFGIEETRLDGEPAESRRRECDFWEWIEITAIHDGRGYVVWAVSTTGPAPRDRPINDQFLESFSFTD